MTKINPFITFPRFLDVTEVKDLLVYLSREIPADLEEKVMHIASFERRKEVPYNLPNEVHYKTKSIRYMGSFSGENEIINFSIMFEPLSDNEFENYKKVNKINGNSLNQFALALVYNFEGGEPKVKFWNSITEKVVKYFEFRP